jgi:FkbM family methyltransferase
VTDAPLAEDGRGLADTGLNTPGAPSHLDRISETLQSQTGTSLPLSYAQNLEDYHLSLAFAGQPTGTYIDVGGGHPVAGSVSFWFYERGWQGLVVEPQERLAALHRQVRPRDTVVSGLIGAHSGSARLFVVDRLHALTTTIETYADNAKRYGAGVQSIMVPAMTLAELCTSHDIAAIDFLKIDVEGAEADVIAGGDWRRHRPKVVVVEAIKPLSGEPGWEAWEGMLLAQGYQFALFDTLNRFYVADEHPDIRARLPAQQASWDAVRHMYEIGRAGDNAAHPDHQLALALVHGFLARLPHLPPEQLMSFLDRESKLASDDLRTLERMLADEALRMRLGRIACGYDGGQLIESETDASSHSLGTTPVFARS